MSEATTEGQRAYEAAIEEMKEVGEGLKKSYSYRIVCPNCVFGKFYDIPRGESVAEFKAKTKCEYCGCPLEGKGAFRIGGYGLEGGSGGK